LSDGDESMMSFGEHQGNRIQKSLALSRNVLLQIVWNGDLSSYLTIRRQHCGAAIGDTISTVLSFS